MVVSRALLDDQERKTSSRSLAHVPTSQPKKSAAPCHEFAKAASSTGAATQDAPKHKSTTLTLLFPSPHFIDAMG